ncbi:MAG: PEP/pyruvate-binding domain-containing protein [Desulfobacterales bacterium]|nr:PEP/pyruvate-binding domain-containing protein [Desulfobacterales bacterium]
MPNERIKITTGIQCIDELIDGLRWGDNVVWQVTNTLEYSWLVRPFVESAVKNNVEVIYVYFDEYAIAGLPENCKIVTIDPSQGFDYFYQFIRQLMESSGKKIYYVFDNISILARHWGSDESVANFFRTACPRLFELDTIAYFCILRGSHNNQTVATIRDTTQVLVDFYVQGGQSYICPLKAWQRYSPTMFKTHLLLSPLGKAPEGPWHGIEQVPKMMGDKMPPESEYLQSIETLFNRLKDHTCWSPANCEALRMELIKTLISERSEYFERARKYFSLEDIEKIHDRLVGSGRIGGKAAGMLLAQKMLDLAADTDMPELKNILQDNDSYYIGSDTFFQFVLDNDLLYLLSQQYQDRETIVSEYPNIQKKFLSASFRPELTAQLRKILEYFGTQPIIVRSSSLLEDNFGYAFAGKYDSVFCPNQGIFEDRFNNFLTAIKTVYSSVLKPDALLYRIKNKLINTDEQMGLLVMRVEGRNLGNVLLPMIAGVGFSRNFHPWSPRINTDKGLLRIVFGLGTRAVDRVGNDYPRMVALSHPTIRPVLYESEIKHYSQHSVDLIDSSSNELKSMEINELVTSNELSIYQHFFSVFNEGTFVDPISFMQYKSAHDRVLTFNNLIAKTPFASIMDKILEKLETAYGIPVDIEFIADIDDKGQIIINLLQCRPLSEIRDQENVELPEHIDEKNIIFKTDNCVVTAFVNNIRYIVYVDSDGYKTLAIDKKYQVGRAIGRINALIEAAEENYCLIGPGRWGSNNIDLGVNVTYADIDASSLIVEVAKSSAGYVPEVSYGTHFFQDLVENRIYYLAVFPGFNNNFLNEVFLHNSDNFFLEMAPQYKELEQIVRVIKIEKEKGYFQVAMDRIQGSAVCFVLHTENME